MTISSVSSQAQKALASFERRRVAPASSRPTPVRPEPVAQGGTFNAGKIGEARLDLIPSLDDCKPGLHPTEYNVLIATAAVAETMGVKGLIRRSDQDMETEQLAMQIGRIVAMSPLAFGYERWPEGAEPPKVGDIVWFARYAGGLIEAAFDGRSYRLVKDKDIAAVIDPP